MQTYKAARDLLTSPRWQRIYNAGARPQRLLWASTGTKDETVSKILYVKTLAAPYTVNTMPEATLQALFESEQLDSILPADGGDCEAVLSEFAAAGVNIGETAERLQAEGAKGFVDSWRELMAAVGSKSYSLKQAS
jgi:transaldolase